MYVCSLRMNVCMYLCMRACMHACLPVCMYDISCMYICRPMNVRMYACCMYVYEVNGSSR